MSESGKLITCKFCGKTVFRWVGKRDEKSAKYCSNKCKGLSQPKGANHPSWKGGKYKNSCGYFMIYVPDHPNANRDGMVPEHRYVYEQQIGRLLCREETVHHIDGDRSNNSIENLKLFSSVVDHSRFHRLHDKWDNRKGARRANKNIAK